MTDNCSKTFLFINWPAVFSEHGIKVAPEFRTADDEVITGRKTGEAGETFTFHEGLYTDDAGLLFETHAALELGARLLKRHVTRFGLVMHCGKISSDGMVASKSKTEAVFYPQASYTPTPNDTLPLRIDDALASSLELVPAVQVRRRHLVLHPRSRTMTRLRRGSDQQEPLLAVCGNGSSSAKVSAPRRSRWLPKASCTAPLCSISCSTDVRTGCEQRRSANT
jgi:hypothetical protein